MKNIFLTLTILVCFLFSISHVDASVMYTVKENDSLWSISQTYNTSPDVLQEINGLKDPSTILPGQSILIPGSQYVVESGDSLWKIANLHQTSMERLKKHNGLSSYIVHRGQRLEIPQSPKRNIEVGAFFVPGTPADNEWAMNFYSQYLSGIGFFEYHPDENGNLSRLHGEEFIKEAWKQGMTPHATITNLTSEGFDPALAHTLLSNPSKQQALIENMAELVDQKQYKGVIIDFESLHPKDRSHFNSFIKKLSQRMRKIGGEVGLALPPLQADRYPAHNAAFDYQTLGQYADFIFLMTYDWHWAGGEAGPIAPIKQVDKTIQYASSVIPNDKIYLGFAMYAYDWILSPNLSREATAYSQQKALTIAANHSGKVRYNVERATPWFQYYDDNGSLHEVWFEDARSILPKLRLVKKYDLKGLGGWKAGLRFPQAGHLIKEEFNIMKR